MIGEIYPIAEHDKFHQNDMLFFRFTSNGHRPIKKLVAFTPTVKNRVKYYNWAFGDIHETSEGIVLNDKYPTNNGDVKKVFYTVVSTLSIFFSKYPTYTVHIKGSDDRRTKLYVSLIARHWQEISQLYSVKMSNDNMKFDFNRNKECDYILISRLLNSNFE